jgi:hypothetical protein
MPVLLTATRGTDELRMVVPDHYAEVAVEELRRTLGEGWVWVSEPSESMNLPRTP